MNRCVYCLHFHERKARCCCLDCERRVRGKATYVTRSRRETAAKYMLELQQRLRFVPQWRKVAMGADPDLQLIFGSDPDPGPTRHGETLDAA